jgi:hypothetical protein
MNERDDDTTLSAEESISDEISERVRSVISAAESAATAIRHEAEQQAQIKRRAAEAERQRFIETAKAEAEAMLQERMKRIAELSDSIIEGGEKILMRIDGAEEVKRQLETMVHALADAAEELAAESESALPPPPPRPVAVDDEPAPRMRAVPDAEPDPAVVTELRPEAASEPAEPGAEPVPDAEPETTEAEASAARRREGPAEPSDLEPVDVVPDEEDDSDVEVVDAVEVVDEPDEPKSERRSPVERLRHAASAARDRNGAAEEAKRQEPRGFEGDDMLAARLVALQMAVAGSARIEVEEHLRKTFSMEEPGAILNDVFGTESKL